MAEDEDGGKQAAAISRPADENTIAVSVNDPGETGYAARGVGIMKEAVSSLLRDSNFLRETLNNLGVKDIPGVELCEAEFIAGAYDSRVYLCTVHISDNGSRQGKDELVIRFVLNVAQRPENRMRKKRLKTIQHIGNTIVCVNYSGLTPEHVIRMLSRTVVPVRQGKKEYYFPAYSAEIF